MTCPSHAAKSSRNHATARRGAGRGGRGGGLPPLARVGGGREAEAQRRRRMRRRRRKGQAPARARRGLRVLHAAPWGRLLRLFVGRRAGVPVFNPRPHPPPFSFAFVARAKSRRNLCVLSLHLRCFFPVGPAAPSREPNARLSRGRGSTPGKQGVAGACLPRPGRALQSAAAFPPRRAAARLRGEHAAAVAPGAQRQDRPPVSRTRMERGMS